jgi:hypothetical protein
MCRQSPGWTGSVIYPVKGPGIKTGGARLPCWGSSDPSPPPDRSTPSLEHVAPVVRTPSCERPLLSAPMTIPDQRSDNDQFGAGQPVVNSTVAGPNIQISGSFTGDLLILLDRPDYRPAFLTPGRTRSARSPGPSSSSDCILPGCPIGLR